MLDRIIAGLRENAEKAHELAKPSNPAQPGRRTAIQDVAYLTETTADLVCLLAQFIADSYKVTATNGRVPDVS